MAEVRRDSVVSRFVVVALGVPTALTVVMLGLLFAWRNDLPQPIATHWGPSGAADGFGSLATVAVLCVILGLAIPVFIAAMTLPMMMRGARGANFRLMGSLAAGVSTLNAVLNTWSVGMQRGIADAHNGPSLLPALAWGFGVALAVGVLAWHLQPRQATIVNGLEPGVPLSLTGNERVVWMRTATMSRPFLISLYVVVCGFVVVAGAMWVAGEEVAAGIYLGGAALLALMVAATVTFHVKVDRAGLSAVSALGWPRLGVALADVADAGVAPVQAFAEFGGWGVRLRPGAVGIILRNGQSLQVTRRSGKRLVITVDDAETAAALLTALVAKRSSSPQVTP